MSETLLKRKALKKKWKQKEDSQLKGILNQEFTNKFLQFLLFSIEMYSEKVNIHLYSSLQMFKAVIEYITNTQVVWIKLIQT